MQTNVTLRWMHSVRSLATTLSADAPLKNLLQTAVMPLSRPGRKKKRTLRYSSSTPLLLPGNPPHTEPKDLKLPDETTDPLSTVL